MPFIFVLVLFSCGPSRDKITVACASNLATAMDSIAVAFEEKGGTEVEVISGASGTLFNQIEQSAPYDVFISAHQDYTDKLHADGIADKAEFFISSKTVIVNVIGVSFISVQDLLMNPKCQKIGIADPEIAPFGMAAKNFLNESKIWMSIQDKLVIAESLEQVNNYIQTEAVDVAFTSESFMIQADLAHDYFYLGTDADPVSQYITSVKNDNQESSKLFIEFVKSNQASKILKYFGH